MGRYKIKLWRTKAFLIAKRNCNLECSVLQQPLPAKLMQLLVQDSNANSNVSLAIPVFSP